MAALFTPQMAFDALVVRLNEMRAELTQRFQANEDEHRRLREAVAEAQDQVSSLSGRLGSTQLTLDATTAQGREVLEALTQDS